MNKDTLKVIKDKRLDEIGLRFENRKEFSFNDGLIDDGKIHVMVCGDTGCQVSASLEIKKRLHKQIEIHNLEDKVEVHQTGCFGLCEVGPNIIVYPQGIFYTHVKLSDIDEIVDRHFKHGQIIDRLLFDEVKSEEDKSIIKPVDEVTFYKKQVKIALSHVGLIDPDKIEDYIAVGGYSALAKCLEMQAQEVIDIIKESGLRGRGGAGFSTGLKWQFTKDAKSEKNMSHVMLTREILEPLWIGQF